MKNTHLTQQKTKEEETNASGMTMNVKQLIYSKGSAQWKTTYSKICLLQSLEWLLEKTEIYLDYFFSPF